MLVKLFKKDDIPIFEGEQSQCEIEFVADLIANKEDAWEQFIDYSAGIISRHRQHLEDFGLSIDDLVSETFLYLTQYNHQRLHEFLKNGKSFIGFVYNAVKAAKSRLFYSSEKKRRREVSDSSLYLPHIEEHADINQDEYCLHEYRELLKQAFFLLWESNSQRAYIYFLRRKMELPSKEVAELLGMTISNVDVVLKRAESELKDILEEMGISDDLLQH